MRAVLCREFKGADALEVGDIDPPVPADDEVLIEVHAASVSFMDKLMSEGGYQLRPELPYSPGTEAAGIVIGVGANVTQFKPGDRIAGQLWYGGYAEQAVLKAYKCVRVPDAVSFAVASTVLHNYLTAYYALASRCALREGETLMVTGATGGVGIAAVEMGKTLGARVIAGIGDDAKAAAAKEAGADEVVNYRSDDVRARVKEITGQRGLDVCLDMIGGDIFLTLARLMAWDGRISPIGFTSGNVPALPMNLPLLKNFSVVGVFLGAWVEKCPGEAAAAGERIMAWVAEGKLRPKIDRIIPLDQAAEAMRALARRETQGRIVLEPSQGSATQ